jgi:hypothetical protein
MPFLTDNKFMPLKVFVLVIAVIFTTGQICPAAGTIESVAIDSKTIIHLPASVKTVLVENYTYSPKLLTDELRAYTFQQAVFWTIATLALASAVARR